MTHQNIFGTDGIRTRMGSYPLTIEALPRLGMAIAQWAQEKYNHAPTILLGHDTRQSCSLVKSALQTGLLCHNAQVHDAQVIPTPALCNIIHASTQFDIGIIISASHNPWHDNGIKIVDGQQGKLSYPDELRISTIFNENKNVPHYANLGELHYFPLATQHYIASLNNHFSPQFLHGKKIALDCANGATSIIAPEIFKQFGAQVIVINAQPNGTNINQACGALHPEALQKAVIEHGADAGFAFDGDGDRVIAVARNGAIKDGDDILAVLLDHPNYMHTSSVIGTVMTNQGFDAHLAHRNKSLLRAPVGDKFVSERMEQEKSIIGGEQSGHIILHDYLNTGDGIFTALRIVETLLMSNNWMMNTFKKFPQVLINIPVGVKKDLALPHLACIIQEHATLLPQGRILVRYSGTESVLRILVEDSDAIMANFIGTQLSEQLATQLSAL